MQDEETATDAPEGETVPSAGGPDGASVEAGKRKAKRAGDKPRRSHAERAMANIRSAKKGQREVSDPVERAQFLLAEANVLALLELADAISGNSVSEAGEQAASPE